MPGARVLPTAVFPAGWLSLCPAVISSCSLLFITEHYKQGPRNRDSSRFPERGNGLPRGGRQEEEWEVVLKEPGSVHQDLMRPGRRAVVSRQPTQPGRGACPSSGSPRLCVSSTITLTVGNHLGKLPPLLCKHSQSRHPCLCSLKAECVPRAECAA